MKVLLLFLLLFSNSQKTQNESAKLTDYYYNNFFSSSELPQKLIDTTGSFTILIERKAISQKSKRILYKAETLFPPKSEIVKHKRRAKIDTFNSEPLWWYDTFDRVRLPYALTGSSVNYYIQLIRKFRKNKLMGIKSTKMITASFEYNATVSKYESFIFENKNYQNVYVVIMELDWKHFCGSLCALMFSKKRIMIFDGKSFELLGIIGDGIPVVVVS